MSSYPTKSFRRTALAPGILGAIVLLAGLALLDSQIYYYFKIGVAVLAGRLGVGPGGPMNFEDLAWPALGLIRASHIARRAPGGHNPSHRPARRRALRARLPQRRSA